MNLYMSKKVFFFLILFLFVLICVSSVTKSIPYKKAELLTCFKEYDGKSPFYFCSYVIPYDYLWVSLRASMYNDCFGNYAITVGTNCWWFGLLAWAPWSGGWAPYFAGWQYPKNLGEHEMSQMVTDHNIMWGANGIVSDFEWDGDIQSPEESLVPYPQKYKGLTSFYGYYFTSINIEQMDNLSQSDYMSFFDDSFSKNPLEVSGNVRTLRWNYPNADAFNIHIVTLQNNSENNYNEFYVGIFMDPDVDWNNFAHNVSLFDPETGTAYSYCPNKEELGVVGVTVFDISSIKSCNFDLSYDTAGDWSDAYFWNIITSDLIDQSNQKPHDALMLMGLGPFSLPSGATVEIAWANPMGYDVSKFKQNVKTARKVHDNNWIIPNPPPESPFLMTEPGNKKVDLRWSRNRNYIPKPLPGGLNGSYTEDADPSPEYSIGSEASEDPPGSGIHDWDGYRVYRNLTGMGDIELGDYALVTQMDSTYIYNTFNEPPYAYDLIKGEPIPERELNPKNWTETYFCEYTDNDPSIFNGFTYYYSVCAYDRGDRSQNIDPAYSSAIANVQSVTPAWYSESTPKEYKGKVEIVPNPYIEGEYTTWATSSKKVDFIHLIGKCTIKVYTISGLKIRTIYHTDNDADESWNLNNDKGQFIAPGAYIFRVIYDDGSKDATGKFMVIR